MSNVSTFTSKDSIREQASLWISRLDRGLSAVEKMEFSEWVNQSDSHKNTVFQMANLWDDMTVLNELSELFPLESEKVGKQTSSNFIAIAASVVFAVMVGSALLWSGMAVDSFNEKLVKQNLYQTEIGQTNSFTLPDGSLVHLNTDSQITFDFSLQKRVIYLNKGEAQFDVVPDKSRPFTVVSGEKSFTALGTIFNVQRNNSSDMELLVTEGRVLVTDTLNQVSNIADKLLLLPDDRLPGTIVTTGEKVTVSDGRNTPIETVSDNVILKELSWQQGTLIFDAESLADVLDEVSRYSQINFAILDKEIADYKVSGYFKTGDIDSLVASLEYNFDIKVNKPTNRQINLQLK